MTRYLPASLLLVAALLTACAPAFPVSTVVPLDTAVAMTMQAIAAAATPVSPTLAPQPTAALEILPRPLYFRNPDLGGLSQLYRIGIDAQSVQQITFEPLNVDAYGISPRDGSIAFVTNNQLYLVDSGGGGRRMLVDGGPIDPNNPWVNTISAPVWSPDGTALAYGNGGLNFIDPQTGSINRVLENQIDTSPGFPIVKEIYAPRSYSPEGSRLLIDIGYYEGGTYGLYVPADNTLVRLQRDDGGMVCCHAYWIPDGSGLYFASDVLGMVDPGLYHADAATGNVTTLIPGASPDATYNLADGVQVGPDNDPYFFFNNLPEIPTEGHTPLYLVRAEPDGVSGRTQLLPDAFQSINEILWDAGASLVVLLIARDPADHNGGAAQVVYVDGRPGITLVPSARDLKWGY